MSFHPALVRAIVIGLLISAGTANITMAAVLTPNAAKLQYLTAREYGLDPASVSVSNIQREEETEGLATYYYDAKIQGKEKKCYISSGADMYFTPMCAKSGTSISRGAIQQD
jgi:hypothetical protein